MSGNLVLYEVKGKTAVITLNRPEKLNALSPELGEELREAFQRFQAGDERVAVITGAGDRAFSAGADLKAETPVDIWRFTPGIGVEVDKPVIAAVNGWCIGGAVVVVEYCDLCIAAENATFSYPEAKVGISGGLITSLAARIPHKVAMEFVLLCEDMSAERAYQVGFVNKVVPQAELMDAAMEYASRLESYAPMVLSMIKRFTAEVIPKGPTEQAGVARRQAEVLRDSFDFAEGRAAFSAKRQPNFEGR